MLVTFKTGTQPSASHNHGAKETEHPAVNLQNLRPFMILPAQTEPMCFFEHTSIKHLNIHPCESWQNTLLYFSQTVPSVRHAAVALSLVHRNYLDRHSSHAQSQNSKNWPADQAPLLHYNRAIQLLLNQQIEDSTEATATTLLVCYLFTCLDHLAGNYVQAMKHLRGGVELSRNVNLTTLESNNSWEGRALIHQTTRQIRRLDMQAATFLVDWTPQTLMSQFPPSASAFPSLDEAADHLHILIAQVMRLRNTEQQTFPTSTTPPQIPSLSKYTLHMQLKAWLCCFEFMLQHGGSNNDRLISLLRLQHTITCILLHCYGPGREMNYDSFLPQFQQCVALAEHSAAVNELKATFTPEIGIIPALYIIGVKCRDPGIRRQVLRILRRRPIREAVWDSIVAARVVEWVMEIEEGGLGEVGTLPSMEQIGMWVRVETVSWVHVVGESPVRLDIMYTFCGHEGVHLESVIV